MKLLIAFLSGVCVLIFAHQWYSDVEVPAWQPLIWCGIVFLDDLKNWLESR